MQRLSETIQSSQLKLQMGLSPEIDVDVLTLRAMWRRSCREQALSAAKKVPGAGLPAGAA